MDIPINAEVRCADELCGRSTSIIVNPITQVVTHIVVKEKHSPHNERLVPETFILRASPDYIQLRCSETELSAFEEFVATRFVRVEMPANYPIGGFIDFWPYAVASEVTLISNEERIPPGELAIHRGARVEASDGHIGRVDEFLVDPTDGRITHLILREGHLWGQKDVTIPLSQIDHLDTDTVYLKLEKAEVGRLPTIPVHRLGR